MLKNFKHNFPLESFPSSPLISCIWAVWLDRGSWIDRAQKKDDRRGRGAAAPPLKKSSNHHKLAESIPWHQFLGLKRLQIWAQFKTTIKSTHLYGLSYWKIDETMLQATNSPNEAFLRSKKEITMEESIGDVVIKLLHLSTQQLGVWLVVAGRGVPPPFIQMWLQFNYLMTTSLFSSLDIFFMPGREQN